MAKNLVVVNLTSGDGNFGGVDASSLQAALEVIAEGNTTVAGGIDFIASGEQVSSGRQYMWVVDDSDLTTAESAITTFISGHQFAETPTWVAIATVAAS